MPGQTVAYIRTSSADQNSVRQVAAVGQVDRTFTDQISGKSRAERTGLADLIGWVARR